MDEILKQSALFRGMSAEALREVLEQTPHLIQRYEKGEIIFQLMEPATRIGVILEGRVEAQKTFPNGSQVNVSVRGPGALIGPAAAFSRSRRYPCGMVALEPVKLMVFQREDLLRLMQKNLLILENLTTDIASATYMLQQRLELFSYSGIAQKAAFWLLTQARQNRTNQVQIPESVSKWALRMNVSRPSLHRELKRLEARGVLRYAPPVIEILDSDALQELLG